MEQSIFDYESLRAMAQKMGRLAAERRLQRLREGYRPCPPPEPEKPPGPLCQGLHDLLGERLGPVAIGNSGRARFVRRKRREVLATEPGEFLRTNCAICRDVRQQLVVSYTWDGSDGRDADLLGLPVRCWANDCMADEINRQKLAELVFGGLTADQRKQILVCRPGRQVALNLTYLRRRPGPGKVIPLRRLPADHPAVSFLRGMGYHPNVLGEEWGVTLCVQSRDHPAAEGRLIIPVTTDGVPVGWQALFVGERDWKGGRIPCYYTPRYFRPESALYNLDRARRNDAVVVCEEPADVWRVGPAGVALFSSTASRRQISDLRELALQRQLVFLRGTDNASEVDRLAREFGRPVICWEGSRQVPRQPRPPVVARLPEGSSTAMLSLEELWELIREQAREQGVAIGPQGAAGD